MGQTASWVASWGPTQRCSAALPSTRPSTKGTSSARQQLHGEGSSSSWSKLQLVVETATGGWSLSAVYANDGLNNWTYLNRSLLTDQRTLGSVDELEFDYKAESALRLPTQQWLFHHVTSDLWASYDVGQGQARTYVEHMAHYLKPNMITCHACVYPTPLESGLPMNRGNLEITAQTPDLCSTDLYFSPSDCHDAGCMENVSETFYTTRTTYGPAWSSAFTVIHPHDPVCFDHPVNAGIGTNTHSWFNDTETNAQGFASGAGYALVFGEQFRHLSR